MYNSQNYNFTGGGKTNPKPKENDWDKGISQTDDPTRIKVKGTKEDIEAVIQEQAIGDPVITTTFTVDAETGCSSSVVVLDPNWETLPDLNIAVLMMAHCAGILNNARCLLTDVDKNLVEPAMTNLQDAATKINRRIKGQASD